MPCHGEPPGFTPRAISHNRQNRKFSACRALKKAAENQFYQEIATANTENGNCPADGVGLFGSYRSVPCVAPSWRHGNRCGSSCRENKVVTVARWQNGLSARLVWK